MPLRTPHQMTKHSQIWRIVDKELLDGTISHQLLVDLDHGIFLADEVVELLHGHLVHVFIARVVHVVLVVILRRSPYPECSASALLLSSW